MVWLRLGNKPLSAGSRGSGALASARANALGSARANALGSARSGASSGRRAWLANGWLLAGTIAVAVTSYSLSLKVAEARQSVERLARQNRALAGELKTLDAEFRVRMRMPQLQSWNDEVFGLVPIAARQVLASPALLTLYERQPPAAAVPRPRLAVRDEPPGGARPLAPLPVASLPVAPRPAASERRAVQTVAAPAPSALPPSASPPAPAPAEAPVDLLQQVRLDLPAAPPASLPGR